MEHDKYCQIILEFYTKVNRCMFNFQTSFVTFGYLLEVSTLAANQCKISAQYFQNMPA